jgi:hypothetical protein
MDGFGGATQHAARIDGTGGEDADEVLTNFLVRSRAIVDLRGGSAAAAVDGVVGPGTGERHAGAMVTGSVSGFDVGIACRCRGGRRVGHGGTLWGAITPPRP